MGVLSQIYFLKNEVKKEEWETLIEKISEYIGLFEKWKIIITKEKNTIHYYVLTKYPLPTTMNNLPSILFKKTQARKKPKADWIFLTLPKLERNVIDWINEEEMKRKGKFIYAELTIRNLMKDKRRVSCKIYRRKKNQIIMNKIPYLYAPTFLTVNFEENKRFFYDKVPKYLEIKKAIPYLSKKEENAILSVSSFPYLQNNYYWKLRNYDFDKHSLILGSSGSGKSKLLSLIIEKIAKDKSLKEKYKVVVIDPHASMEEDIGGLGKVMDFESPKNSIRLFENSKDNIVSETELLLELLTSLMSNQNNSKLERVLRHSIYLLLSEENFHFETLRKLLLDTEYRNDLVIKKKESLPESVVEFFLTDFNELKTKSYTEAISPIISLIDEMEMLPVLKQEDGSHNLEETINNHFLTIFSLNRITLGDKICKTLSGLILQQLFLLMQKKKRKEHILLVMDEVPIIENPILTRFLSEARKYQVSLFLAAQYFNQISKKLQDSIFANVINYYIFKVSKLDASLLVDNFNMKIPLEDTKETKIKFLSEQNPRECVVRVSAKNTLLPAFHAKTMDLSFYPRKQEIEQIVKKEKEYSSTNHPFSFQITTSKTLKDLLRENSTSRKVV